MHYLCRRYPENNLFTLKKGLIPIEDMKRLPVRVTALFIHLSESLNNPNYLHHFSFLIFRPKGQSDQRSSPHLFCTFEMNFEGTNVRKNKKNNISFGFLLTFLYLCARFGL